MVVVPPLLLVLLLLLEEDEGHGPDHDFRTFGNVNSGGFTRGRHDVRGFGAIGDGPRGGTSLGGDGGGGGNGRVRVGMGGVGAPAPPLSATKALISSWRNDIGPGVAASQRQQHEHEQQRPQMRTPPRPGTHASLRGRNIGGGGGGDHGGGLFPPAAATTRASAGIPAPFTPR